jgi:hypothetical protein
MEDAHREVPMDEQELSFTILEARVVDISKSMALLVVALEKTNNPFME